MAQPRTNPLPLALAGCLLALGVSCSESGGVPDAGDPRGDAGVLVVRCGPLDDPDMDRISSEDEGTDDLDDDGLPNDRDPDADGDGFPDIEEAGDADCNTHPVDTDGDGLPDFLDVDANGDGLNDADQTGDTDDDGIPDSRDTDVDGDGIANEIEFGPGSEPVDSDGDEITDVFDLDSDGDTILDQTEGAIDTDRDGTANYLDLDSDDDGILDAVEAGDGNLETPPVSCPLEIDPVSGEPQSDARADFIDTDSDNDGLADAQEIALGTDPCDLDSDDDGIGVLAEGVYEQYNCPDGTTGTDCGCATNDHCQIPEEHFYLILPYNGAPQERDLDFGTDIRVADVFFLTDTTGSMGGTLARVQQTVSTPGTGLIDRIRETIPDAWFGGGAFRDFPMGGYGSGGDDAFELAIRMTSPSMAASVASAFGALTTGGGSDGPKSHTEALYQTITGEGGMWTYSGGLTYNLHRYVGDCLDSGWGAPCFRDAALAIVVLFSDVCAHEGPPGESSQCTNYVNISPPPANWLDTVAAMNRRGAKFVGISTRGGCDTSVGPNSQDPCYFLQRTAEESGSVDLDSNALVYNLPSGGASDTVFIDTVVGAIETVATRVPLDLDTAVRDDRSDTTMVDASRFVKRRQPACSAIPPADECWVAPPEVDHDQAIAFYDQSTFYSVIPGTRVTFRITFQNDFYPGGTTAEVYIAFIDVRTGTAVLDTRQVIIVVPANPDGGFG